jgi:hypothetical protein
MMASKKSAKASAAKHDSAKELYVGLIESEPMRRDLLETRKDALILLKRVEKTLLMREQRIYLEGELRKAVAQLSDEIDSVMSDLPELPKEPAPKKSDTPEAPSVTKAPKDTKQLSEIDRKLAEIDKRLADLQ